MIIAMAQNKIRIMVMMMGRSNGKSSLIATRQLMHQEAIKIKLMDKTTIRDISNL